jgi:hypothetical protein
VNDVLCPLSSLRSTVHSCPPPSLRRRPLMAHVAASLPFLSGSHSSSSLESHLSPHCNFSPAEIPSFRGQRSEFYAPDLRGTTTMQPDLLGPGLEDAENLEPDQLLDPQSRASRWDWAVSTRRVTDPAQKFKAIGAHGSALICFWANRAGFDRPTGSTGSTRRFQLGTSRSRRLLPRLRLT